MAFFIAASASSGTYAEIAAAVSTVGSLANITDSNTAVHDAIVAGGGANNVLAWFDGTEWRVLGVGG